MGINSMAIPGISVVINTLNEENNISECISSVKRIADEIIVCDMYSDDKTVDLAKGLGAKICYHERCGFVEPARYYAISQTRHEYILVIDADERMTERLAHKLKDIASENKTDLVQFGWLFNYFGDYVRHGGFFKNDAAFFFRRSKYFETYDSNEEKIHCNFQNIKQKTGNKIQLSKDYYILHEAYPDIEKYIIKTLGKYSKIEAEQRYKSGEIFKLYMLIGKPAKTFVESFFIKRGYKDGIRGFILCVLFSIFHFNIHANLWYFREKEKGIGI